MSNISYEFFKETIPPLQIFHKFLKLLSSKQISIIWIKPEEVCLAAVEIFAESNLDKAKNVIKPPSNLKLTGGNYGI